MYLYGHHFNVQVVSMSQTILYARVSTADQNLDHQQAQAEAAGFAFDRVISDHGTSGVSTTLRDRKEGRRLFDILRPGDTLVVRWVDRLGRNYSDVTDTMREFLRMGVTVRTVINDLTFDGSPSDPMKAAVRDALIAFMAATAQAQAEATKEAQRAGIEAAKAKGDRYLGARPSYDHETLQRVRDLLASGETVSGTARTTGLTRQTVLRIRDKPEAAEAALERWANRPPK